MNLTSPRASVTCNGVAVPFLGGEVTHGLYQRSATGSLRFPFDAAKQVRPYAAFRVEGWYAHETSTAKRGLWTLYADDAPVQGESVSIGDLWLRLDRRDVEVSETLFDLRLKERLEELLLRAGVQNTVIAELGRRKKTVHPFRCSVRQAIEECLREWELNPLLYVGPFETFYVGVRRDPGPLTTLLEQGKNILDRPQRAVRDLGGLDFVEGNGSTLYERYMDEETGRAEVPYWRLRTFFAPWIWPGDKVHVTHEDLNGDFLVVTRTQRFGPFGTELELEEWT